MLPGRTSAALAACALLAGALACPRYMRLPPPPALPDPVRANLEPGDEERLSRIRIALGPSDQQLLERSLADLAADSRLPKDATRAAIHRALGATVRAEGFCDALATELASLALTGPVADAPPELAVVASIDAVYEGWLSDAGRARHPDRRSLARAIRDGAVSASDFRADAPLGARDRPTFATDAALFDRPGAAAGELLCLFGPPTESWVVARIPTAALPVPPRVPTAADAVCRPRFVLPPPDARQGRTCAGTPELVTPPLTVGAVRAFGLTR